MKTFLQRLYKDEAGVAMVEYALLAALIGLVAIVGLSAVGANVNTQFLKISCKIATPSADCTP